MSWHSGIDTTFRTPLLVGCLALATGFGGFGAWVSLAPLEGAVVASGVVAVAGSNQLVQHLEGGIVREIRVGEGAEVAAGDPLIVLDATAPEVQRNRLRDELARLAVLEARLAAERDGRDTLLLPEDPGTGQEGAELAADQRAEFAARLERHRAELEILARKNAARGEEIAGLEAQERSARIQIGLIAEERADAESLLEKGLIAKSRVLELARREADLIGSAGSYAAEGAKVRQAIAETEQEIVRLKAGRVEEAIAELGEMRRRRADLLEQFRSAQDALDRIIVRAPVAGSVIDLERYNVGAVLAPGARIMEIVPSDRELIVEARIHPRDIDEVAVGQPARLAFSGLDARRNAPVPGSVIYVSADRTHDRASGESFYLVRLRIEGEAGTGPFAAIGAGAPVEVFLTTGERTFLAYLLDPISAAFRRGLRES